MGTELHCEGRFVIFNRLRRQLDTLATTLVLGVGRRIGKQRSLQIARRAAFLTRKLAQFTHRQVFELQWRVPPEPEWQDHHTSIYVLWDRMRQPVVVERGCVSAFALKDGSEVLDICCGDGFYDYYFYSRRAKRITAVDFDPAVIAYARTYNQAPNISYEVCDIRAHIPQGSYDNIIWNGAIEHFTEDEIKSIVMMLHSHLKPGGVLSGYTIAAIPGTDKQLSHHEYEFRSKEDLLRFFKPPFSNTKVFETIWAAIPGLPEGVRRHNLYFYAADDVVPFDDRWPHTIRA